MKSFELRPTKHPQLFRVVDTSGDWRWYYLKSKKRYLRSVTAVLTDGYAKGPRFYQYLKMNSPEEIEKKLTSAGERGDSVHQLIAKFLENNGKVNIADTILAEDNRTERRPTIEEWEIFLTFAKFWADHEPKLITHELPTYNLKWGFAGTIDAVITLTKLCGAKTCDCKTFLGKIGVWDWKTGSGIRNEYGAQVAAYGNGENLLRAGVKAEYTAIARFGTNHKAGYETEFYDKAESKVHWKEFEAALTIAEADSKPFNENSIYDIPESVELEVKKVELKKPKNEKRNNVSKAPKNLASGKE